MTMHQLWKLFAEKHPSTASWLRDNKYIESTALGCDDSRRETPSMEILVDALEVTRLEWARVQDARLPGLVEVQAAIYQTLVTGSILLDELWQPGAADTHDKLQLHRALLQKIVACREPGQAAPWLFSTNYDLAIEWAAESIELQVINGFLGMHNRRFTPHSFDLGIRNVQARGEARFGIYNIYLAKLHGSLTWEVRRDEVIELSAQSAWEKIDRFRRNGGSLGLMVVPGAAKYVDTIGFALGELLRRFAEFLARQQACLIVCGYSFGDNHINRLLRSALLNPTLQLFIYLPEFNGINSDGIPAAAAELIALRNPRVLVVGGGSGAFLEKLVAHLPEPSLYDEDFRKLRQAIQDDSQPPASRAGKA